MTTPAAKLTRQEIVKLVSDQVGGRPEAFIDFVEGLQEAARSTAEHVETNWQDHKIAVRWSRLAASLEKVRVAYGMHAREMGLRT